MIDKEKISHTVIRTLYTKFSDFPEDAANNRNAPFHEAFLKAFENKFSGKVADIPFFISLNSWFHGLNTTLGQTFFEKVAHILSDGTKKEFKGLKISTNQQTMISDIITDLKNGVVLPNLKRENELIYKNNNPMDKSVPNFTVDCYYEEDNSIIAIELKTVKPNSGVFKGEKEKILAAKAGLKNQNSNKEIYYFLGFPFDPLSKTPTGFDKNGFLEYSVDFKKFFDKDEVLLADELWNFLSGEENTMQQIIDIINSIAKPEFMDNYEFINNTKKKTEDRRKYLECLHNWNLITEIELVEAENKIIKKLQLKENKRLNRIYTQPIFKEGTYNIDRAIVLKRLI